MRVIRPGSIVNSIEPITFRVFNAAHDYTITQGERVKCNIPTYSLNFYNFPKVLYHFHFAFRHLWIIAYGLILNDTKPQRVKLSLELHL